MKNRRALSTVVGMVFAIIAFTTTAVYVSYSMNLLGQYNNTVLAKNQALADVNKEKFQIGSVAVVNNKLNVTLINTGTLPINFTKIWIQNTTTTDWIRSYAQANSFVSPGATLTNLGQGIPAYINPANSYNVKLVTSRGASQAFTVNSASAAPLNIQLLVLPSTVTAGFKTTMVLIVTNNSTGTLTNISPSSPVLSGSGSTYCSISSASPTRYNTLAPGNTAIFKWDVTISSQASGGLTCTYTFNPVLQNGYPQTVWGTLNITPVSLTTSTYAQASGLLTINYTSFKWTQGNQWNNGWSVPSATVTDFQVTLANNNQTGGGYNLWLSKNTQMYMLQAQLGSNAKIVPYPFFIASPLPSNPPTPPNLTGYTDYSQGVPNQGGAITLYFGAVSAGSNTQAGTLQSGAYFGFLAIYGKFAVNSGDPGTSYAQNIPFMAVFAN
jgi:hypothetical protein